MDSTLQSIYLNIPQNDVKFFKELAKKMGWAMDTKESLLKKYITTRPKQVNLSDDEILSELAAVRYKK